MNIRLSKNAANVITVTLKERQTLDNPYWLFVFYHETDLDTAYAVILTDSSSYTTRYNQFTLTLPDDLNLTLEGQYRYYIYEQSSAVNLEPDNATTLCEQGIAEVVITPTTEYF